MGVSQPWRIQLVGMRAAVLVGRSRLMYRHAGYSAEKCWLPVLGRVCGRAGSFLTAQRGMHGVT